MTNKSPSDKKRKEEIIPSRGHHLGVMHIINSDSPVDSPTAATNKVYPLTQGT